MELDATSENGATAFSFFGRRTALLLQAALIIGAGWWIYWPALHGDWLSDDRLYVTENPLLNDPARVWKAWFQPGSFIEYYPLHETVQWVQWKLWGKDTLGYHVTNVVLHLLSALLLWRLLLKFGLRLAWLGGLIFVIHPVMVESVAWIAELKNTLSLPPALLAMCAWIDYEEHKRRRDYGLALGFFLAAMLCKITLALFPLVILLYAWWKRDRITWSDLKVSAPFFLISLVLTLTSFLSGPGTTGVDTAQVLMPHLGGFFWRLALAGQIISFYFTKSLIPIWPSSAYYEWTVDPRRLWQFLPWPVLLGVIYWLWTQRHRWGRAALLGLGFFLINLAPFIGFISISYMVSSWVYDHFLYLPIIGLIGLVIAGLGRLDELLPPPARLCGRGVFAVTLALLAWESHDYAKVFINEETASLYNLKLNPQNYITRCTLGDYYLKLGRVPDAMLQYEEALEINPNLVDANFNLGVYLFQNGRWAEGMAHYWKAQEIDPNFAAAHANLGSALAQMGRLDDAIAQFRMALEIDPRDAEVHYDLGVAYSRTGRVDEAIFQYQKAIEINPNFSLALANLGILFFQNGRLDEAIDQYQKALQIDPHSIPVRTNLGIALFQRGRFDEAISEFEEIVSVTPDDANAQRNLATARAEAARRVNGSK